MQTAAMPALTGSQYRVVRVPANHAFPAASRAEPQRRLSVLLSAACSILLLATLVAAGSAGASSRLNQLALAVGREAEPVRVDFARAAISEMAAAHVAEAKQARREARSGSRRRGDLLRWAGAVDAYATELAAIGDALTAASVVEISIGADNSIYLNIGGRPVLVGSPRAREQGEFEQRIMQRFCASYPCENLVAGLEPVMSRQTGQARPPVWSFSQYAGPSCSTEDGLELQFRTLQDLARKREICARLVAELNLLLVELDAQLDNGVRIDWNRLAVQGDPNAERQQVVLNGFGDTLPLAAPGLVAVPDFLRRSLPWVAARTRGDSYHLVLLNGEDLLAPLLYP